MSLGGSSDGDSSTANDRWDTDDCADTLIKIDLSTVSISKSNDGDGPELGGSAAIPSAGQLVAAEDQPSATGIDAVAAAEPLLGLDAAL